MIIKLQHIILVICLFFGQFILANTVFNEGIEAFEKENYKLSSEKFTQVIEETPNDVAAYYNLGLSEMSNERLGNAVWAFEKVLKLKPNDSEAAEHLEYCTNELGLENEWTPILNNFLSGIFSWSSNTWSIAAIVLSFTILLSLIAFKKITTASLKRLFLVNTFFCFLLLIGSVFAAYGSKKYRSESNYAVITQSAPTFIDEGTTAKMKLPEGLRVKALDKDSSEFIRIQLNDTEEFLVKFTDLSFI